MAGLKNYFANFEIFQEGRYYCACTEVDLIMRRVSYLNKSGRLGSELCCSQTFFWNENFTWMV